MHRIIIAAPARRYLKRLQRDIRQRILKRIHKLAEKPYPTDMKRVVGFTEKVFRVRVGDHRIVYHVNHEMDELVIIDVDKRERVY